jgi:hypothetical protein
MADRNLDLRQEVQRMLDLYNQYSERRLRGEKVEPKEMGAYLRLKARVFRAIAAQGSGNDDPLQWAQVAEDKARQIDPQEED